MEIICLDLEGVLVPEIWIAFAEKTGIPQLKRTTRDEPDYDKLMKYRMDILKEHNLTLKDIQDVIATIKPLEGAKEFLDKVRSITQVVILSDTFKEFAKPLMKQLGWPTILCNSLITDENNMLIGMKLRQQDGKRKAIDGFRSMNFRTFAAGDSYNDLTMIHKADKGCLFRAPENILKEEPDLKLCTTYDEFFEQIKAFVEED
ncbi:MAG: bifunctional phosphoserine phosphatase/homoserine phosphotransferase ThrH [Sphaerochaetaceae bacterium]|nr:bifunctional phosphoserine phosphatase/homoserine phosphotransferase ThrH [Sphaerochaetaceae bacterium]